jgi:membrane protein
MAYYAILSLFPTMLFAINVVAHINIDFSGAREIIDQLVPENVVNTILPIVHDLHVNASTTWLSVGAIVTLWAASLGLAALRNGFNRAYGITRSPQNFIVSRMVAMVMMVVLLAAVVATMVAFAFGQQFLEWLIEQLNLSPVWLATFQTWRWPIAVAVLFVVLVIVDFYLPNARMRFWTVLPGVVITGAGLLGFTQVFSIYIRYFGQRFTTYGTLGAFIVILLWLFFMSFIVTLGVVVNSIINETFYGRAQAVGSKVWSAVGRLVRRVIDLVQARKTSQNG